MTHPQQQVLVVDFRIHAPHVAAFAEAIAANARASLEREAGCRQFDVCADPADADRFFLYEIYDDEAAVQAHLQSQHFLTFNAVTAPWVHSKTVQRLLRMPL